MERKAEDMSNGIICSYLMRQINFIWERIAKQWLKNTDLSWTQVGMIGLLAEAENYELSLKQLEKELSLSQSVIARMANHLTKNGYTEDIKNPSDKRVKKIRLLEKGLQCHHEIFLPMQQEKQPMLEGMSFGEKILFQELLERVLINSIKVQEKMKNDYKKNNTIKS